MVRIAVARRLLTREIHYTGIDVNRSRLESVDWLTRTAAKALQAADPTKRFAMGLPLGDAYALNGRIKERFIRTELDLHDPAHLAAQLDTLLGKDRFGEVHVHLLHSGTNGCQPAGPQVLRVIAKYLRPGARLYHLFEQSSPLFDFKPERLHPYRESLCPAPGSAGDALGRDEARFRQGASRAGLMLDKCGHRWEKNTYPTEGRTIADSYKNWVTRRFSGTGPDRHTAATYQRLAEQYSGYSRHASHFVILRKRERPAVRRRRAPQRRLTGV